mmetsp:Transcript_40414/g.79091  ORF Transcript_40414/g.79091 Transcript_40414/m.79091 type:complete len:218 (+) Transcript_40414:1877-2530(+)
MSYRFSLDTDCPPRATDLAKFTVRSSGSSRIVPLSFMSCCGRGPSATPAPSAAPGLGRSSGGRRGTAPWLLNIVRRPAQTVSTTRGSAPKTPSALPVIAALAAALAARTAAHLLWRPRVGGPSLVRLNLVQLFVRLSAKVADMRDAEDMAALLISATASGWSVPSSLRAETRRSTGSRLLAIFFWCMASALTEASVSKVTSTWFRVGMPKSLSRMVR